MKRQDIKKIPLVFLHLLLTACIFGQQFPTAHELAEKMTIGWNIGNTMEAVYDNGTGGETYWGNPLISQRLIDSVKASGFNTIRIPVAWEAHSVNGTIDAAWISRVKEVVDYCYANEMYVIINIHWDNGWLEQNCTEGMKETNNAKQANYWQQIATFFKDYDEHLLFASANEPHVADADEMAVLLSYHQTFINTVRATGGNNAERILIVQGPATDIDKTNSLMTSMPTDPAPNRLMAEVHFYPYQLSLMDADADWGKQFYYWGACNHSTTDTDHNPTWGEEDWVDDQFQKMKTQFVDKGIPVVLGEFGVKLRTNLSGDAYALHVQSREYYFKFVAKSALNHGLIPIYWCAGLNEAFDRENGKVLDPGAINAMMAGTYTKESSVNCSEKDCLGTANGHAYTNECGQCTLGFTECNSRVADCNGALGGSAYLDDCNVCVGGNTGKTACVLDCNGVENGTAFIDGCGECVGGDTGKEECVLTFPTAPELAEKMTIGWNIGNTMEAIGGENAWGNPNVTQKLIDSVKAAGFNTIRIPCAWDTHAEAATNMIDAAWIARVKEIVDYCVGRDLYAVLNIHWDGGWLEENCTEGMKVTNNAKQARYWQQIATYFKDYDEHLLFASANEPHVADADEMAILLSYHQTFINTVRATGGNNAERILIVQGPATDIDKTNNLMTSMPTDPSPNRLMAEVHFYPYQFSLMDADADWGKQFYYWGACNHSTTDTDHNPTWGEEDWVDEQFRKMKTQFVDKGIPVFVGEFGANKRLNLSGDNLALHIKSREYYYKYITNAAKRFGLIMVYWDTGYLGGNTFTIFDRNTGEVADRGALNALMMGTYGSNDRIMCGTTDCNGVTGGHSYLNECNECISGFKDASACGGDIEQIIELAKGWNLISVNVHPSDSSVETIFKGVNLAVVKTFDDFWDKGQIDMLNSLKTITAGKGYLVYANQNASLAIKGQPMKELLDTAPLQNGWNLIGTPYQNSTPFSNVFNSSNCKAIKSFDGLWMPESNNNTIDQFEPGRAYFLKQ